MKSVKRLLSLIVIICTLACSLCSCAGNAGKDAALVYVDSNGKSVQFMSKNMYSLWLSFQKAMYSFMAQNESDWELPIKNEAGSPTLSEFVKQLSTDSAKKLVVAGYLFDSNKELSLSNKEKDEISAKVSSFGSSLGLLGNAGIDEYLSAFGANAKTLEEYFTITAKYDKLFEYFFGQDGVSKISEQEKKDYFENNYVIADHIYINVGTQTKADGTSVALTEEERQSQTNLANKIYAQVLAGENFNELKKQYTNDAYGATAYPDGFFVTKDGTYTQEFQTAAFEMAEGEIRMVESTRNGSVIGIHIMKKLPMDKEKYNLYDDILTNINATLASEKFDELLSEYIGNVAENTQITDLFDIKLISSLA